VNYPGTSGSVSCEIMSKKEGKKPAHVVNREKAEFREIDKSQKENSLLLEGTQCTCCRSRKQYEQLIICLWCHCCHRVHFFLGCRSCGIFACVLVHNEYVCGVYLGEQVLLCCVNCCCYGVGCIILPEHRQRISSERGQIGVNFVFRIVWFIL
jgi:hypothetical protein